jgi:hypothetical protein
MIESWKQFFNAVALMREHQKVYFADRDRVALTEAKKLEAEVDECISRRKQEPAEAKKNKGGTLWQD